VLQREGQNQTMALLQNMVATATMRQLINAQSSYDRIHQLQTFEKISSRLMLMEITLDETGLIHSMTKVDVTAVWNTIPSREIALNMAR